MKNTLILLFLLLSYICPAQDCDAIIAATHFGKRPYITMNVVNKYIPYDDHDRKELDTALQRYMPGNVARQLLALVHQADTETICCCTDTSVNFISREYTHVLAEKYQKLNLSKQGNIAYKYCSLYISKPAIAGDYMLVKYWVVTGRYADFSIHLFIKRNGQYEEVKVFWGGTT